MSERIYAIMALVENAQFLIESNLRVETENHGYGLYVSKYDMHLDFDNPNLISSSADGFRLWRYFQFINRRSSDLRNRYFDIVRALGLQEMWFMWEDLEDYFDAFVDDLPTIVKKMTAERHPREFVDRDFHEFNLQALLQQTPDEDDVYPYGMFYHDSFSDLFQQVEEIEKREDVIVLGLTEFEEDTIRVMHPDGRIANMKIR